MSMNTLHEGFGPFEIKFFKKVHFFSQKSVYFRFGTDFTDLGQLKAEGKIATSTYDSENKKSIYIICTL